MKYSYTNSLLDCNVFKGVFVLIIWGVLSTALSVSVAQEIEISMPFMVSETRNEAVTHPHIDFNHDTCALIIVDFAFQDIDFEGDINHKQYVGGEWWIYLSPGANWLTVLSDYHTPLRVDFAPVQAGITYTIGLRSIVTEQTIMVTDSCRADITMVDARRYSRIDSTGRLCALLRIGFVQPNVEYSGAIDQEYRHGEWWVWLPVGTTEMTVRGVGLKPLIVKFDPLQTAVTYVMTLAVEQPKQKEIVIVGSEKADNWSAAFKSALLPGLGQMGKGHVGSGIFTLTGELMMASGAVYSYIQANKYYDNIMATLDNDGNSGIVNDADVTGYNTYRMAFFGLTGAAAVLYVYNIIRAATMKNHRRHDSLALTPSLLSVDGTPTPSFNLVFTF